jgi:hypothetical protein
MKHGNMEAWKHEASESMTGCRAYMKHGNMKHET